MSSSLWGPLRALLCKTLVFSVPIGALAFPAAPALFKAGALAYFVVPALLEAGAFASSAVPALR